MLGAMLKHARSMCLEDAQAMHATQRNKQT